MKCCQTVCASNGHHNGLRHPFLVINASLRMRHCMFTLLIKALKKSFVL